MAMPYSDVTHVATGALGIPSCSLGLISAARTSLRYNHAKGSSVLVEVEGDIAKNSQVPFSKDLST